MTGFLHGGVEVFLHEQVDALLAVLHSARGVDARANLEDYVAHGHLAPAEPANVYDGLQANRRVLVELLQAMEGEDAVLVDHGNEVGGNAHGAEVEKGNEAGERDAIVL